MALFLFSIDLTGFSNKMIIRIEKQGKICKEQTCQVWNTGKSVNYFCGKMKNAIFLNKNFFKRSQIKHL